MTTESAAASDSTENAAEASTQDSSPLHGGRQSITPAERWVLICEDVYSRAQKRGFVGGAPLQDLADAEQEIDAAYETDFKCVFSLTSAAEITEQLKGLFAGYGFDREDLKNLLDGHQEGLEGLAAMNRDSLDRTSTLVIKQTQLLQDVANEAVQTLQSFTQGRLRPEGVFNIAELSMEAFDSALKGLQRSTTAAPETPADGLHETSSPALLEGAVADDFKGCSAKQLLGAPLTALKGVSGSLGKKLEEGLGISTIGDLAANKHAEWARAVVSLASPAGSGAGPSHKAETGSDLPAVADSRVTEVRGISERSARLFREELGIETVSDLGTHPLFNVARAIVMLAESEA